MDSWFTVEEIDSDTFAISEYKHWEETHCYLVCGTERAILIDTGLGISDIRKIVNGLTSLPVMAVTTHVHWDHIGGHKYFENIAVHEAEKDWLSVQFPIPLQTVKNILTCRPCDFPEDFVLEDYQIFRGMPGRFYRMVIVCHWETGCWKLSIRRDTLLVTAAFMSRSADIYILVI